MKMVTQNLHNQICTRKTTRNDMNQNYIKYMTCQLQVAYYRTNKNYCYSELLTWTIQDSTQLLSLQPPLFLYKRFKKNYNWRSSRQIHVLNLNGKLRVYHTGNNCRGVNTLRLNTNTYPRVINIHAI